MNLNKQDAMLIRDISKSIDAYCLSKGIQLNDITTSIKMAESMLKTYKSKKNLPINDFVKEHLSTYLKS